MHIMSMVCTVDLGPIDRNVYNVGDLIDDDYINRDNRLRQSNYVQYPHPLFPANSVRGVGIFHWKQKPIQVSSFKNGHLRPLYDNFINTLYLSSVRY